ESAYSALHLPGRPRSAAAYDRILQFLYPGLSPSVTANTRFLEEDVVLSSWMPFELNFVSTIICNCNCRTSKIVLLQLNVVHGCGPGQYTMFYMKYTHFLKRGCKRGHLWLTSWASWASL
ncbi:unnamed protein product, partial [Porites lobata]